MLENREPESGSAFACQTNVDSTLRYLGVELEEALSIAERIDN